MLSRWSVVGIEVAAGVALVGLAVVVVLRRRSSGPSNHSSGPSDHSSGPSDHDTPAGPPDPARRQFVERGMIVLFVAALSGVVASALDYVWPSITATTGGRFRVASRQAVKERIAADQGEPYYDLEGRFYLAQYPSQDLASARKAYPAPQLETMELGLVALSQKCPHLGCTVKWCKSSGWFECPCHGSRYNPVGELERGPAPRGLDRFPVRIVEGVIEVDTSVIFLGPPPGTMTTDQPAKGPHCY